MARRASYASAGSDELRRPNRSDPATPAHAVRNPEDRAMLKPYPCLWFDGQAEEAARFYTSIFPDSRIDKVVPAAADFPSGHKGDVVTVAFTLSGARFVGLNGGPEFTFDEAISFVIDCADQAEVDRYWGALVEGGGEHGPCGWLKDRF